MGKLQELGGIILSGKADDLDLRREGAGYPNRALPDGAGRPEEYDATLLDTPSAVSALNTLSLLGAAAAHAYTAVP